MQSIYHLLTEEKQKNQNWKREQKNRPIFTKCQTKIIW